MFVIHRGNETGSSQEAEYSGHSECDLLLGCCCLPLVFLSVLSRHLAPSQRIPTENMALIHAAFVFVSVCAFSLAAASLGSLILRILQLEMIADREHLLICTGEGVISIEMLLFGVEVTQQIRKGCLVVVGLLCLLVISEFKRIAPRCSRSLKAAFSGSRVDLSLLLIIGIVLGLEFSTVFLGRARHSFFQRRLKPGQEPRSLTCRLVA
jgi:hypothetical protein